MPLWYDHTPLRPRWSRAALSPGRHRLAGLSGGDGNLGRRDVGDFQVDDDLLLGFGEADVAGLVNRLDADEELVGQALGGAGVVAPVFQVLAVEEGGPRPVALGPVQEGDAVAAQELVLGTPVDGQGV